MTATVDRASVRRDGDALVFLGTLDRAAIPALWTACAPLLTGITRIELTSVDSVDSAGVALLAELSGRAGGVVIDGVPCGLVELRRAYRLGPTLDYAS